MKMSLRWYGESDPISLEYISQIPGMHSIVSAVYDVKPGEVWPEESLAKMKDGVVIINTSRGANVDEDALLAALESGKVRAAGLDVYADEPTANAALYSHPMVSCTPHIGAATVEAQKRIGTEIVDIIRSF